MFEAVIFDFGGVVTESPFEAFNRLESSLGIPQNSIRRINATNPDSNAWARFERSEVSPTDFDTLFGQEAAAVGIQLTGRQVLSCLHGAVRPQMLEALRRIASRLKTGCITNNVMPETSQVPNQNKLVAEAFSLFEHVIESSKLGIRKPDPRIYEMMLHKLNLKAQSCVYLDDLGINLKPAKALGMTTIKVQEANRAIDELQALLGFELR